MSFFFHRRITFPSLNSYTLVGGESFLRFKNFKSGLVFTLMVCVVGIGKSEPRFYADKFRSACVQPNHHIRKRFSINQNKSIFYLSSVRKKNRHMKFPNGRISAPNNITSSFRADKPVDFSSVSIHIKLKIFIFQCYNNTNSPLHF